MTTDKEIMDLRCWCLKQFPDIQNSQNAPTDPAAALAVLQKCCERIPVSLFKGIRDKWQAQSYNDRADWCIEIRNAETLPLAICLFARELFKEDGK